MLPTEGRYGVADLENLDIGSLRFDPQSSYEVNLPFKLQGALAGLADEVGRIYGSFNRDGSSGVDAGELTIGQFFTMISQTLTFDGPNFGALLDLTNVSLDAALEGSRQRCNPPLTPVARPIRTSPSSIKVLWTCWARVLWMWSRRSSTALPWSRRT